MGFMETWEYGHLSGWDLSGEKSAANRSLMGFWECEAVAHGGLKGFQEMKNKTFDIHMFIYV